MTVRCGLLRTGVGRQPRQQLDGQQVSSDCSDADIRTVMAILALVMQDAEGGVWALLLGASVDEGKFVSHWCVVYSKQPHLSVAFSGCLTGWTTHALT